jgi:S1-C subfamily serine protease
MITFNALSRTFHLRLEDQTATGFLIDVESKQYLVTAKHFVPEVTDVIVLELLHDGIWKKVSSRLVGHASGEIDITVLALPYRLVASDYVLKPDMGGIILGQEAFFLGFPYGLFGQAGELNSNYPMPFVKRATVSSLTASTAGPAIVFLDGHNNPGFSGGPVLFKEQEHGELKIAAVVSGYRFASEPVYHEEQKLPFTYRYNTGIIISYSIKHAVEIATANPIGVSTAI